MKKIAIIIGHPNPDSYAHALSKAYISGVKSTQTEVKVIDLSTLTFDPILKFGYQKRMELEPDLVQAQETILWADHLVVVHPVWWGGLPALLKGFFDRAFIPGFSFKYRTDSVWWDQLLKGKTGRIITTLDQPSWFYRMRFGRPSVNQLKRSILGFCGVKNIRVSYVTPIRNTTLAQRQKQLEKVEKIGKKDQ